MPPGFWATRQSAMRRPCSMSFAASGFSTREEADRASGRGMGMAVVRTVVEELGGFLTLETQLGKGTHFRIQLPLTLAIADALIVSVAGQTFAVAQVAVREVIQVEPGTAKVLENNEIIPYRSGVLPLLRLAAFFGLARGKDQAFHVLVVGTGLSAIGLVVERVLELREIVVRPAADPLIQVTGVAGATELGDGRAVLILDTVALSRVAQSNIGPKRKANRPRGGNVASSKNHRVRSETWRKLQALRNLSFYLNWQTQLTRCAAGWCSKWK